MAASFTLARQTASGKISNIVNVEYDQHLGFECIKCARPLKCVLNHPSPHFKHKSSYVVNCNPTPESLLHRTAKEILLAHHTVHLPEKSEVYHYDTAIPEKKLENSRQPDILLKNDDNILLVEIVVTSKLKYPKIADYKAFGERCLVIDLSKYDRLFDMEKLTEELIVSTKRKSFLHFEEQRDNDIHIASDDGGFSFAFWITMVAGVGLIVNEIFPNLFKAQKRRSSKDNRR